MIHAAIYSNGLLCLQADTELEAFALAEWERRKKLGKAKLTIETTVRARPALERREYRKDRKPSGRIPAIEQFLRENGPANGT
jgi:hypothetical protein